MMLFHSRERGLQVNLRIPNQGCVRTAAHAACRCNVAKTSLAFLVFCVMFHLVSAA